MKKLFLSVVIALLGFVGFSASALPIQDGHYYKLRLHNATAMYLHMQASDYAQIKAESEATILYASVKDDDDTHFLIRREGPTGDILGVYEWKTVSNGTDVSHFWTVSEATGLTGDYPVARFYQGYASRPSANQTYYGYMGTDAISSGSNIYTNKGANDANINWDVIDVTPVTGKRFEVVAAAGGSAWIGDDTTAASQEFGADDDFTSITLHARPNEYYKFLGWKLNGEIVSTEADYTVTELPSESVAHYTATFEYIYATGQEDYTFTVGARSTTSLAISDTDGNNATVGGLQSSGSASSRVYYDKTDCIFTTTAGASVTIDPEAKGPWMHRYFYIDRDKDGFDYTDANTYLNSNCTIKEGADLVFFSFYSPNGADDGYSSNSNGQANVSNNQGLNTNSEFTIPADLQPGTYRARYKVDWNHLDPTGWIKGSSSTTNSLASNGGIIVDFTIKIEAPAVPEPVTTLLRVATTAGGTAWIGDDSSTTSTEIVHTEEFSGVTLHAEADQNYEFVKWTLNGETVSTEADYTIAESPSAREVEYIAHFVYGGNASVHISESVKHRLMIYPSALNIDATKVDEAKTKSYSIGMWFMQTNSSNETVLMSYGTSNHNNYNGNWVVKLNTSTGKISLQGHGQDNNGIHDGTETEGKYDPIEANVWNHLVVIVDQAEGLFKVFVNNKLAVSSKMPATQDGIYLNNVADSEKADAHFMFGCRNFTGYIDEIQLFSSALTNGEVYLVYNDIWYATSYPRNAKPRLAVANKGGAYNVQSLAALYTYDSHLNGQYADQLGSTSTTSFLELIGSTADASIGSTRATVTAPTIVEQGRQVGTNGDVDTSIDQIESDAPAAVEYFDMQGRRVAQPGHGLYIRRAGNVASKVIL